MSYDTEQFPGELIPVPLADGETPDVGGLAMAHDGEAYTVAGAVGEGGGYCLGIFETVEPDEDGNVLVRKGTFILQGNDADGQLANSLGRGVYAHDEETVKQAASVYPVGVNRGFKDGGVIVDTTLAGTIPTS